MWDAAAVGPQMQANFVTTRIPLANPLLGGFNRRGRRKLREIEEAVPDAYVKFDKGKRQLIVSGTSESIEQVKLKVECMTGPRVRLAAPAWAELMRTRTQRGRGAIVWEIQRRTGSRLHIERCSTEVRVFGPEHAVLQAERALTNLNAVCSERVISMAGLNEQEVCTLAQEIGVSFRVEGSTVSMMGFKFAVENMFREVGRMRLEGERYVVPVTTQGARGIEDAIAATLTGCHPEPKDDEESDDGAGYGYDSQSPTQTPQLPSSSGERPGHMGSLGLTLQAFANPQPSPGGLGYGQFSPFATAFQGGSPMASPLQMPFPAGFNMQRPLALSMVHDQIGPEVAPLASR